MTHIIYKVILKKNLPKTKTKIIKTPLMRLKLTLSCPPNSALAFDHHHTLRAVIYRIIEQADSAYSLWLHEQGFMATGKKNFKLFSFDLLRGQPFRLNNERKHIIFPTGVVEWTLGFYIEQSLAKFIEGLFKNQVFEVATMGTRVRFQVESVQILETPSFTETMRFRCETGICLTEKSEADRYEQFRSPDDTDYTKLFFNSLAAKVYAATGETSPPYSETLFDLKILSTPKKWSTLVPQDNGAKPIRTIGYKYDFSITAPLDFLKVGYFAGFGKGTSGGFGWVEVLKLDTFV